jgi:hypothetical protein
MLKFNGKMRGIYQRGDTFWYARQVNGRRTWVSLETGDYAEAVQRAMEIREKPELQGIGPFETEIERFLKYKLDTNRFSRASVDAKGYILKRFAAFIRNILPNVIGRSIHGYSSSLMRENRPSPFIRRIFVRDLTPETHGNAVGIGLADVTTSRLVSAMDQRATYINALTALTPQSAKVPIHFDTDREAIERVLASLAIADNSTARIVRIADTLSLVELEVSEALREDVDRNPNLTGLSELVPMQFDSTGNMTLLC